VQAVKEAETFLMHMWHQASAAPPAHAVISPQSPTSTSETVPCGAQPHPQSPAGVGTASAARAFAQVELDMAAALEQSRGRNDAIERARRSRSRSGAGHASANAAARACAQARQRAQHTSNGSSGGPASSTPNISFTLMSNSLSATQVRAREEQHRRAAAQAGSATSGTTSSSTGSLECISPDFAARGYEHAVPEPPSRPRSQTTPHESSFESSCAGSPWDSLDESTAARIRERLQDGLVHQARPARRAAAAVTHETAPVPLVASKGAAARQLSGRFGKTALAPQGGARGAAGAMPPAFSSIAVCHSCPGQLDTRPVSARALWRLLRVPPKPEDAPAAAGTLAPGAPEPRHSDTELLAPRTWPSPMRASMDVVNAVRIRALPGAAPGTHRHCLHSCTSTSTLLVHVLSKDG
jgi:hypothetical protein